MSVRRHRRRSWLRRNLVWFIALGLLANLIAVIALVAVLLPRHAPAVPTSDRYAALEAARLARADVRPADKPASVLAGIAPVAKPELFTATISRIRIPRINVDAPIQQKGIKPDGTMESPNGPDDVAWYGFTPKSGLGGNAVYSGHVDYINHGPAVFWDLKKLQDGDQIEVLLIDGVVLQYQVSAIQLYDTDDIPMQEVLAQTATESVTLITCGGDFAAGSYSHRLVLRATRSGVVKPG